MNVLSIPPNDWLGARLVATFAPVMNDSRGELWTVTFDAVAVTLFDGDGLSRTTTERYARAMTAADARAGTFDDVDALVFDRDGTRIDTI